MTVAGVAAVGRYFLRLGTLGFGGPVALVAAMHHDLVEQRGWFTEAEYREGVALAQLAPGPLAAQLAIYLGWLKGGARGATVAGLAFIAPSFAMVMVLSAIYVRYGGLPWMRGAFYGIGAAVIAIIARSAVRLVRQTVRRDGLLYALAIINLLVVAISRSEILWVFLVSGVIAMLAARRRRPPTAAAVAFPLLLKILAFFAKAGAVVFGSGLAILPFLYGGVVQEYAWLTESQFLDAVAVSMITPGPVVITVAFIGYLTAGPAGGVAAAIGVFLPVYLFVVLAAPHFRRIAANASVAGFVAGVTAAASGALAGAVVVLGMRAIVDLNTLLIAALTLGVLALKRVPEPILILAAGLAGVVLASPV